MDTAVSCVGQSALLSRSVTDAAAVARAISFSLAGNAPEHPAAATTMPTVAFGTHPPPTPARSGRLGPAGGRAGKRRPRPSKRAPTTYISTDAATFRLMVQRVTGADDNEAGPRQDADHLGLGLLLPRFGAVRPLPPPPDPAAAAAEQQLFPTLDSWNVMYEKNDVA